VDLFKKLRQILNQKNIGCRMSDVRRKI